MNYTFMRIVSHFYGTRISLICLALLWAAQATFACTMPPLHLKEVGERAVGFAGRIVQIEQERLGPDRELVPVVEFQISERFWGDLPQDRVTMSVYQIDADCSWIPQSFVHLARRTPVGAEVYVQAFWPRGDSSYPGALTGVGAYIRPRSEELPSDMVLRKRLAALERTDSESTKVEMIASMIEQKLYGLDVPGVVELHIKSKARREELLAAYESSQTQ